MSGGLAPSKSTVYVSNLPFSLTNNDLHKIFERHGKVVKVTVVKDRTTHESKGVAFVLFLDRDSAHKCIRACNNTEMFGRTIKCSIAADNGRAPEFIRRKTYPDKSRCYECGEEGHLSYRCPNNLLGEREPPKKKERKRKKKSDQSEIHSDDGSTSEANNEDDLEEDSLSAAIMYQQRKEEEEEYRYKVITGEYDASTSIESKARRKKFKKNEYFSDEEEEEETT